MNFDVQDLRMVPCCQGSGSCDLVRSSSLGGKTKAAGPWVDSAAWTGA